MERHSKHNSSIPEEMKERFKTTKNNLTKFKSDILKKFSKYILGIALLPFPKIIDEDFKEEPKQQEDIPGEKQNSEEKNNKNKYGVLILIDDSDSKKISKFELKDKLTAIINKSAKNIDQNLIASVMLLSELRENCFDGKYAVLDAIALCAIFYDPNDVLAALKISEVHKKMTIKKFEKYVVSYVAAGSLFRGEKSNDIDVYIVVDDTDVKKMTRGELKDKLRAIIIDMGFTARSITGVAKALHVQVYILTDFWESLKEASPVIFTLLRDGIPLYDRGVFMPWKLLLQMGRIKPSPEAIDMHIDIADKLVQRARGKILSVVGEDLYYAALNPAQAALMLYGIPPPTHRETIKLLEDIFVKKEKLLEKRYVDILDKTFKYFKDIEHGKIKDISGKEVDKLLTNVEDYIKRLNKLFDEIDKKTEKKRVLEFYESCISISQDVLNANNIKGSIEKGFEEFVKKGKIPEKFLTILKSVIKAKKDYEKGKIKKQEVEKVGRDANFFIRTMVEILQRRRSIDLERAKVRVKYGENKFGDIIILNNIVFIIKDIHNKESDILKGAFLDNNCIGELKKSELKEMEEDLKNIKEIKKVSFNENTFNDLKKIFGENMEVLINY